MNDAFNTANLLTGHTDEATAYLVDDYPYGFKLRTQIRYWIETTKSGDRFVSQTLNPKTDRWNKPKKSTYSEVMFLFLDENGHVKPAGITHYTDDETLTAYLAVVDGKLSDAQKRKLAGIIGMKKAMEGVTFSIREGGMTDAERVEQNQIAGVIVRRADAAAADALEQL